MSPDRKGAAIWAEQTLASRVPPQAGRQIDSEGRVSRFEPSDHHCHRATPVLVIKKAAVNAAINTAELPMATPIATFGNDDQILTAFQLRSNILPVISAASV